MINTDLDTKNKAKKSLYSTSIICLERKVSLMDNNIADILAKNIHFDYLRQVESIFKQLETGIKKTPEAFIGNSEIADKFYEFMKDIDGFGFALENLGRYDEALMFYMSAGKYLEMSYHLVSKPDANHHIAICDLTVARVYLALNNYLGFAEWYHHFFDNSVAAINDKGFRIRRSILFAQTNPRTI